MIEHEHIKLFSNKPFNLECEVCKKTLYPTSVRTHLKTKTHQKNVIDFENQLILKEKAYNSIYHSNVKVVSS